MKILFIDTETTGLDARVHGIHQLAGEIMINDEVTDKFDYRINPFKGCEVDSRSLAISNTSSLDFLKYHKEYQVAIMLSDKLNSHLDYRNPKDKFFLAGWRVDGFDMKFLHAFFERNALLKNVFDSYFWSNPIDVKTLATQYLLNERTEMESFSLAPVAKHLKIVADETKLHKASYDAYLCRRIYEIVK